MAFITEVDEIGQPMSYKRICDVCGTEIPTGRTPITGHPGIEFGYFKAEIDVKGKKVEISVHLITSDGRDACNNCCSYAISLIKQLERSGGYMP